jgi:hypothetical protein
MIEKREKEGESGRKQIFVLLENKIFPELNNVRNAAAKNRDVYIVEHFSIIEMTQIYLIRLNKTRTIKQERKKKHKH